MKLNNIFIIEANWGAIKPPVLFHLTSKKFLPYIMKNGLLAAKSGRGIYLYATAQDARLTKTISDKDYYDLSDPVILEINTEFLDFEKMQPDNAAVGAFIKDKSIHDPLELEKYKMYKIEPLWYFALKTTKCVLYFGSVPLKAIKVL